MKIPAGYSIHQTLAYIEPYLSSVRKVLESCLDDRFEKLFDKSSLTGGKMIRPAVVILSGLSSGELSDNHIKAAAAIELVHNASLFHDDVIDQADKRRGVETPNKMRGNEAAILLGDCLLAKAFGICAELPAHVLQILSHDILSTCHGEIAQCLCKNNWEVTEEQYLQIIAEKSASLFRCCARLGAILADADQASSRALCDFGLNTGIAFQISDDILDIIGSEKYEKKTLGTDLDEAKPTLPLIHLLDCQNGKKSQLIQLLQEPLKNRTVINSMLVDAGSIDYARGKAQAYAKAAASALDAFVSPYKNGLISVANYTIERAA